LAARKHTVRNFIAQNMLDEKPLPVNRIYGVDFLSEPIITRQNDVTGQRDQRKNELALDSMASFIVGIENAAWFNSLDAVQLPNQECAHKA
jgi:hypothetical protein